MFESLVSVEWPENLVLTYPRQTHWHFRKHFGDAYAIEASKEIRVRDVNLEDFLPRIKRVPSGPLQIVKKDFARKYGYLNNRGLKKWSLPNEAPFFRCFEDVGYRIHCEKLGDVYPLEIFGPYRIRHSKCTHNYWKQTRKGEPY